MVTGMLLVSASTMAMTVRERMREVAILKSMGYTRRVVMMLVLGEAVFVALLGCVVGSIASLGIGLLDAPMLTGGFLNSFAAAPSSYGLVFVAALVIGLVSGIFPAVQASTMTIPRALRLLD